MMDSVTAVIEEFKTTTVVDSTSIKMLRQPSLASYLYII